MKTLRHICVDAEKQIGFSSDSTELETLAQEWVGQLTIVGQRIFFRDRLVLVLQNGQGYGPSYTVLTFSTDGKKWKVSRDLDSVDNLGLIDYFLNQLK